jgi:predicted DNA-binding protein YlxM (UPF0122 family)
VSAILQKHSRMPRKYNRARAALAETKPKQITHKYRLEDVTPQTILTRYLTDESTQSIADDYGVTRQALSAHLIKHAEEDWKDVQMARALARKDKAEEAMDSAEDALQLAKAREMLKSAQWDLERVCKRIYGIDRGEFNINFNLGDLGDRLRRAKERAEKFINQQRSNKPLNRLRTWPSLFATRTRKIRFRLRRPIQHRTHE